MAVMCFDIGGTGVKSAVIDQDKQIRQKESIPTPDNLDGLLDWMDSCLKKTDVEAISISFPGAVDPIAGIIGGISAVEYIHGVSWYELLSRYQLPIFMENDANCVGLSQLAMEESSDTFFCVVCGTGIGGAVIIDRRLIRGPKAYAGEFGCMVLGGYEPPVQNWSQIASTGSLVRYVKRHSQTKNQNWNGRKIFEEAQNGDSVCQEAVEQMVQNFALGLMNLYYVLDPEVIYIGGGISQNEVFIAMVQAKLQQMVAEYDGFPEVPLIQSCSFHQDANLMGAYMNTLQ
ncbi:ROK family protein [Streptococcus merionis]|uniref:ROK family protein n=1 Tax=Streptococcus merionis TaxID=400065 RepID=UPI0026ECBD89|nr:ROK family protein [Streptococcus merionis]